jgi:hypothetical protein
MKCPAAFCSPGFQIVGEEAEDKPAAGVFACGFRPIQYFATVFHQRL